MSKEKDITKIIMNPIRMRIIQYLLMQGQGTTKEIKEELSDVPPASLYRHIKVLSDAGFITVVEEKKVRGTMEKTYSLTQNSENPIGEYSVENAKKLINASLLSLMASFNHYFNKKECDPMKDLLSLSTSTLLLTDEEYMTMTAKIGEIFNGVIQNKPTSERKVRRITFISSPCEEK